MPADDLVELEIMLNRFNRLLGEVMEGVFRRNSFLRRELDLLTDMETCRLERRRRLEIVRHTAAPFNINWRTVLARR